MPEIVLQSISVLIDGGSHEGGLVLTDGHLAAVLVRVSPEEAAGDGQTGGGWFLEAGFGPCSTVMTIRPPVFAGLDQAIEWVRDRLESGLPQG